MNARSAADPVERWREALEHATSNDGTSTRQRTGYVAPLFADFHRASGVMRS